MRIVIETEAAVTAAKSVTAESAPPLGADTGTDAGAAPGAAAASVAADSDGGGPAADLLDAIAAAEHRSSGIAVRSDAADGGAAPQTL